MSSCTPCNNVVTKHKRQSTDNELLSIHTERAIYLKKSQERNKTRDELRKRLSALRNSGGGVLLIHVNGTRAGDRCLKYFDEFVGNIVTHLLEPGEVYANTYRRQWLQDMLEDCAESAGFIHIRVAAVKGVATVDFNTKLGKDYENVIPTTQQLLTVRSHILKATDPVLRNLPPDNQQLHEDIHIQLKGFPPQHTLTEAIQKDATDFVEYLWNKLKLKDSITSMSKIPEGGSFYFGIGEKSTAKTDTYETIIPDVHGFELKVGEGELKKTLKSKLRDCVLWGRSENTFTAVPSDLIAIAFHTNPPHPQRCVLEVAVKCVEGVVFCDSHGPRTYVIEKGQICRMEKENSESKASSGDIHHSEGTSGDNHEVQMAYDEATDDGSSLGSSPYQSDEEIIMSLFAQGNDSTSSSDDLEPLHADFPSVGISKDERNLILDKTDLKRATDPGHRIFPQSTKNYLELSLQNPGDKVDVISREIQNVLHQHVGWAYIAHQMAHTGRFQCRKPPTMSICDVAIIRATQPLHILTFVEDGGKQEHAVEYNAQLTRSIMGFIKGETGVSLDVVYGVVPASTWKDEKKFKEKLECLETVARRKALPGYLHMDTERYTVITKALVDLYSEPGVKDQLESEIIIESLERDGKALLLKRFLNQSETDSGFGRDNKQEWETETQDAEDSVAEDEQYGWGPAGDLIWTREEYQRLQKDFLEPRYNSAGKLLQLKILLFGPTGMGKSSLGNGFRTALLNMEHPSNYHAVTSGPESLTTGFQGALYKNHWIYDMPGIFESRSILSSHIISILSGEVPLQAKIGKDLGITHQTFNTPHDHHVSCVVVVLRHEHGDFGMEIQRQLECVRTTVANGDTSIHLVLTHLDECDHQFRDRANLPNLYQSSKVQEAVRLMSNKTGVLPSSISFVRNYVQDTDADVISKLQHLRVLQRILSSCVDQEEKKLHQEQQERMYSVISKHDQNRRTLGPPTYGSVKAMLAVLLMALMVAVMIKLCNLPPLA